MRRFRSMDAGLFAVAYYLCLCLFMAKYSTFAYLVNFADPQVRKLRVRGDMGARMEKLG